MISTHLDISVIKRVGRLFELLVGEPEANVPGDESREGGVEPLVEGRDPLVAEGVDGAVEGAPIRAGRAVHEPSHENGFSENM